MVALTVIGSMLISACQPNQPEADNTETKQTELFLSPPARLYEPAQVSQAEVPKSAVEKKRVLQDELAGLSAARQTKQILFGDMHVHTSMSIDGVATNIMSLTAGDAISNNAGMACDVARFCSSLDFWGLTDHAESYTERNWRDAKASIRQCNAVAGDPSNPDLVAFMGFEWTPFDLSAEQSFGHHNVHFLHDAETQLPPRPIAAPLSPLRTGMIDYVFQVVKPEILDDIGYFFEEVRDTPLCEPGIATRKLPVNCYESAASPGELMDRLDEWNLDYLVIPHGSAWGGTSPILESWDNALVAEQRPMDLDAIEVFSGHGNSERFFRHSGCNRRI